MKKLLTIGSRNRLQLGREVIDHFSQRNQVNIGDGNALIRGSLADGFSLYCRGVKFSDIPHNLQSPGRNSRLLRLNNLLYFAPGVEIDNSAVFTDSNADTVFVYAATDGAILLCDPNADEDWFQYFRRGKIDNFGRVGLDGLEIRIAASGNQTFIRYEPDSQYTTLRKD